MGYDLVTWSVQGRTSNHNSPRDHRDRVLWEQLTRGLFAVASRPVFAALGLSIGDIAEAGEDSYPPKPGDPEFQELTDEVSRIAGLGPVGQRRLLRDEALTSEDECAWRFRAHASGEHREDADPSCPACRRFDPRVQGVASDSVASLSGRVEGLEWALEWGRKRWAAAERELVAELERAAR